MSDGFPELCLGPCEISMMDFLYIYHLKGANLFCQKAHFCRVLNAPQALSILTIIPLLA